MEESKLPEMIEFYRKKNGWTMKELAQKVGKPESTISLWVNGKRSPAVELLVKMAKIFNVSTDELVFGKKTNKKSDDIYQTAIIKEITNDVETLNNNRQEVAREFIKFQVHRQNNEPIKSLSINEGTKNYQVKELSNQAILELKDIYEFDKTEYFDVPELGEVAAGSPIFAEENLMGTRPVSSEYGDADDLFWLKIRGNSMEPLIHDGMHALIKKTPSVTDGSMAVVMFTNDNEVTLKYVYHEVGRLRLEAENPDQGDIIADNDNPAIIIGRPIKFEFDY
jgi:SOS-response transcriptional repressor LexA